MDGDGTSDSGGGAASADARGDAAMDEDAANDETRAPVVPRHHLLLDGDVIYLNLQIQRFVECLRTSAALDEPLAELASLASAVQALPTTLRRTYTAELDKIAGLLAFQGDDTPIRDYCSASRRSALACQVNSAILAHLGLPTQSLLELIVRQTSHSWQELHERGINVPEGHPLFALARLASARQPDGREDGGLSVLPLWTVHDL